MATQSWAAIIRKTIGESIHVINCCRDNVVFLIFGIYIFVQTIAIDANLSDQVANGNASTASQVHSCQWCYKQYLLRNKLLRHQRAHHYDLLPPDLQEPQPSKKLGNKVKKLEQFKSKSDSQPQTVNLQFTGTFYCLILCLHDTNTFYLDN